MEICIVCEDSTQALGLLATRAVVRGDLNDNRRLRKVNARVAHLRDEDLRAD